MPAACDIFGRPYYLPSPKQRTVYVGSEPVRWLIAADIAGGASVHSDRTAIVVARLIRRSYVTEESTNGVVWEQVRHGRKTETGLHVVAVHRPRIGTSLPDQVRMIASVAREADEHHPVRRDAPRALVALDAGGIGLGPLQTLRQEHSFGEAIGVVWTAGNAVTTKGNDWTVAKSGAMSELRLAMQTGRISVADSDEGRAMLRELDGIAAKAGESGRLTFDFDSDDGHSDRAAALLLAWTVAAHAPVAAEWIEYDYRDRGGIYGGR